MDVQDVWTHYIGQKKPDGKLYHYGAALGFRDEQLIKKQLKRYTVEQLKAAITQTHRNPWNIGEINGKKYLALRLCIGEEKLQDRLDDWHEHSQEQEQEQENLRLKREIERDQDQARLEAKEYQKKRLADGTTFLQEVRNYNEREQ